MDQYNQKAGLANQGAQIATRAPAIDTLNQRLSSVHGLLSEAVGRINMVANKVAGVLPPMDKPGNPVAVPSCSSDHVIEIEHQLRNLSEAISRLD